MITKNHTIGEILKIKKEAPEVLMQYEMGCLGCPSATMETLEQACFIHGVDLEEVLAKLNQI